MNQFKTIYFILPGLTFGGAERVISHLCNHLDRAKFKAVLVLFRKDGFRLNDLKDDVEIIELRVDRIRNSLFPLLKLFKKNKPDIVFCGWGEIAAYLAPFIPFFKKIIFIARETNVVSQHVTRKEIKFFYRFYRNFHGIIAQSDDMLLDLVENFKIYRSLITKINNPIDFDFIEQQLAKSQNIVFPKNVNKKVLAVGNLSHRKGFDLLLNVFAELKNEAVELFILGDGDEKESLLNQKEKLGLSNVHFLGVAENPFPYYEQADLFILSSRYEGFPNALLEANACGTFALCNDAKGGIHEIIESGVNGEILDIKQTDDFANRIKDLVDKETDADRIKESVKSRFSLPIIIQKYDSYLANLKTR